MTCWPGKSCILLSKAAVDCEFWWFSRFLVKKTITEIPGKMPEIAGTITEMTGMEFDHFTMWFYTLFLQAPFNVFSQVLSVGPSRMSHPIKSFVSSSATLAEGLDIMSKEVDEVVNPHFKLDEEEKALQARLEAHVFWVITCVFVNMYISQPFLLGCRLSSLESKSSKRSSIKSVYHLRHQSRRIALWKVRYVLGSALI